MDERSTLLLVDDEQENLNLFYNLFKRTYRVLLTNDGEEALHHLRQEPVAVLLCDQRMPGLVGTDVLAQARELSPDTVRVLVTAYPELDEAIKAINQGQIRRYVTKPWEPDELRALVAQEVDHYELIRQNRALVAELRTHNTELASVNAELADANRELQRLDNVRTDLLTNVSHELRTPLVSVRGYADLMLSGRMGSINDQQSRALQVIGTNVSKLVSLIEDLLDLSRMDQGAWLVTPEQLDLALVLEETVDELATRAHTAQVELRCELEQRPLIVRGDRRRLEQVFSNLLDNAIKFNHAGGQVITRARATRGRTVVVEISDTGEGMAPEHHNRIFERFYQVDASSTRRHSGTGIGLSMARELVRGHGGNIRVSSTPGQGTTFTVELPAATLKPSERLRRRTPPRAVPATPRTAPRRATGPDLKVLVVDDDRELLEYASELLAIEGIPVYTAQSGEQALALVDQVDDIGLILLDIAMPSMDGFEICRALRARPATAQTPIHVVSAHVGQTVERQCFEAGANGHLSKPFRSEEFVSLVRRVLGGSPPD
ncbi:MAG: response regulator [bacterium]